MYYLEVAVLTDCWVRYKRHNQSKVKAEPPAIVACTQNNAWKWVMYSRHKQVANTLNTSANQTHALFSKKAPQLAMVSISRAEIHRFWGRPKAATLNKKRAVPAKASRY